MREGQLSFDTAMESEYPWGFCITYAGALAAHLRQITPAPAEEYPLTLESLIYSQVHGATKGMQDEGHVRRVVNAVCHALQGMTEGGEAAHLRWLLRNVGLRGSDVRITVPDEQITREVCPSLPRISVVVEDGLELQVECGAAHQCAGGDSCLDGVPSASSGPKHDQQEDHEHRGPLGHLLRITKGRSGSKRLNRPLRRIIALNLASKLVVIFLWTFRKWNFADAASRRFE